MLTNQTGPPVKGEDFYGREPFLLQLWERITEGANILLLAPRRVGKSSVMLRLVDEAKFNGFQPLMISVAGARSETEFIREIILALDAMHAPEAKQMLNDLMRKAKWLRRVKKFRLLGGTLEIDNLGEDWKHAAEDLRRVLVPLKDRWLILIDELPIFVHRLVKTEDSVRRAEVFLAWFRDLRVAENAPANVRWFLAGSIGLDTVTRQANLGDTINDLHIETRLGAFSQDVADKFLDELGQRYDLKMNATARTWFLSKSTWLIPYHIQLLFSEIRDLLPKGTHPTTQDIDAAYEVLLSPPKRIHFDFWVQRLTKELPVPSNTLALLLVDTVAMDDSGASREVLNQQLSSQIADPQQRLDQLDFLLQVLQTDGYLILAENRYQFRSTLLRDFWKRSRIQ